MKMGAEHRRRRHNKEMLLLRKRMKRAEEPKHSAFHSLCHTLASAAGLLAKRHSLLAALKAGVRRASVETGQKRLAAKHQCLGKKSVCAKAWSATAAGWRVLS